jgi:hypothetical protein
MPYNLNNKELYDFDTITHQRLSKLVEERIEGKYRDDPDGFAQAIIKFSEYATYDKSRRVSNSARLAKP